jgi:hypothetical protein
MKRFLALILIYSLNIIMFLFAKSAGAAVDRRPAIESGKVTVTKLVVFHHEVMFKDHR